MAGLRALASADATTSKSLYSHLLGDSTNHSLKNLINNMSPESTSLHKKRGKGQGRAMVLREDRQPLAPTMPQSDSPTVRRVSTSSPAAALSRRLGSFKQTYPPASEMSLPLIGAQIERTSSDRPDEIDSASDRASERPISPTQVPLDMLPSSTGFLAPRRCVWQSTAAPGCAAFGIEEVRTAAGPSGSRGRASGGERKEPDSSGVEMHDVAAAASAGTVHGAAPAAVASRDIGRSER